MARQLEQKRRMSKSGAAGRQGNDPIPERLNQIYTITPAMTSDDDKTLATRNQNERISNAECDQWLFSILCTTSAARRDDITAVSLDMTEQTRLKYLHGSLAYLKSSASPVCTRWLFYITFVHCRSEKHNNINQGPFICTLRIKIYPSSILNVYFTCSTPADFLTYYHTHHLIPSNILPILTDTLENLVVAVVHTSTSQISSLSNHVVGQALTHLDYG